MRKEINFDEMNPYVRYVQFEMPKKNTYYLPWRVLYDNFLLFVTQGSVIIHFEDREIQLYENELCIIPPFLKNTLSIPKDVSSQYYGMHFDFYYDESEELDAEVYMPIRFPERRNVLEMPVDEKLSHRVYYHPTNIRFPEKLKIRNAYALRSMMEDLLQQYKEKPFGYKLLLKSTWFDIFHLIISEIKNTEDMDDIEDYTVILRYIQNLEVNNDTQLNITQIALEYGMTPQRFRKYFKALTSKTPKEYLIDRKIEQAKELLKTGRYQVGEVAYMLGYDDIFYFSKLFKRKTGESPKKYLPNQQNDNARGNSHDA